MKKISIYDTALNIFVVTCIGYLGYVGSVVSYDKISERGAVYIIVESPVREELAGTKIKDFQESGNGFRAKTSEDNLIISYSGEYVVREIKNE